MKRLVCFLIVFPFLLTISSNSSAQQTEFALTDARVGEAYRQSVSKILHDQYGFSIASGTENASLQWAGVGKLPPGLALDEDGMISGKPKAFKELPYVFRVKITDTLSPEAEPLILTLKLKVLPPKIRLVKAGGAAGQAPPQEPGEDSADTQDTSSAEGNGEDEANSGKTQGQQALCRSKKIVVEAATAPLDDDWQANIRLKNPAIKKLNVFIQGPSPADPEVKSFPVSNALVKTRFKLKPGKNKVTVFGLDDGDNQVECTALAVEVPAAAQPANQATVTLGNDFRSQDLSDFPLAVKVTDPNKDEARLRVEQLQYVVRDHNDRPVDQGTRFITPGEPMQEVHVKLVPGKNTVRVFGLSSTGARVTDADEIAIDCTNGCVKGTLAESPEEEIIRIKPSTFIVSGTPDTNIRVTIDNKPGREDKNKKVDRIYYKVTDEEGVGIDDGFVDVQRKEAAEPSTAMDFSVSLAPSVDGETRNTITVFGLNGAKDPSRVTNIASAQVECVRCNGPSSKLTGDSLYTRAIVGFEQVGGSGATSTQKPFLDLFFSAPIGKKADILTPAFQLWGNARIAGLTQQTNPANPVALGAFATAGFLNSFQTADVNKIAQGFDFLVGVDIKLVPRNTTGYFSLIPGTKQRTSLSFIASFGGITPLEVDLTNPPSQIFKIPTLSNGNPDPEFIKRFPDAEGKKNIAFVAPTRDRFFRQYYGGVRVKTLFFDKRDNPINRFPAIFDLTIGQNELVTGHLRNVMRFEGFYPFPFKAASFFYLYGTAIMKLGRNSGRTELPLFLEQATGVQATSPDTVLVPIDRNPSLRSSRDSYRLGVGINLIELLNRLRDQSRLQ